MRVAAPVAVVAALWGALGPSSGCSDDLPPPSRVDKLRVLAVRAEPPEVTPDSTAQLDALVVTPPPDEISWRNHLATTVCPESRCLAAKPKLSYLWLACLEPPGGVAPGACGVSGMNAGTLGEGTLDGGTPDLIRCSSDPSSTFCLIGEAKTATYTPSDASITSAGFGQVIITLIVADELGGGALGCALGAASNGGAPVVPDHCVIALKRLTVSRTDAPNHNPTLATFTLGGDPMDVSPRALAPFLGPKAAAKLEIGTIRSPGSAEVKQCHDGDTGCTDDGKYEPLYVSWFATAGELYDTRNNLQPPDCNEACQRSDLPAAAATLWTPPDLANAATYVHAGEIDFWVVVRDDRGGVGWKSGTARAAP